VGGIYVNEALFDKVTSCDVKLTYGVFPGSEDGYTDAYRNAVGLNTQKSWQLTTKEKFSTATDKDFKLVKKKKGDSISWSRPSSI